MASEALAEPGSIAPDRLAAIDAQRTALARAVQLIDVIGVGLLAVWTRRLYGNLRPLGFHELRFGEGWALGGWFVPVVNLVRPKQIVNDIWRAGESGAPARRRMGRATGVESAPLVVVLLDRALAAHAVPRPRGRGTERMRSPDCSFLAWCGVGQMIFSVLTIAVVVRTTSRQVRLATARDREPGSRNPCICSCVRAGCRDGRRPLRTARIPADPSGRGAQARWREALIGDRWRSQARHESAAEIDRSLQGASTASA